MAKKQSSTSAASNIAAAASLDLNQEKALRSAKRSPVAKKHSRATLQPVEPISEESAVGSLATRGPSQVDRAKIAELAYLRWEARGYQGGWQEERQDWILAEEELKQSNSIALSASA